jgi:hypothetical protein
MESYIFDNNLATGVAPLVIFRVLAGSYTMSRVTSIWLRLVQKYPLLLTPLPGENRRNDCRHNWCLISSSKSLLSVSG